MAHPLDQHHDVIREHLCVPHRRKSLSFTMTCTRTSTSSPGENHIRFVRVQTGRRPHSPNSRSASPNLTSPNISKLPFVTVLLSILVSATRGSAPASMPRTGRFTTFLEPLSLIPKTQQRLFPSLPHRRSILSMHRSKVLFSRPPLSVSSLIFSVPTGFNLNPVGSVSGFR